MRPNIGIPAAPLVAGKDPDFISPDIIVHLMDGSIITGKLQEFFEELNFLSLKNYDDISVKLYFNHIRYIVFKDWLIEPDELHPLQSKKGSVYKPNYNQKYNIEFIDHTKFYGETRGSIIDEHCLHLFKINKDNKVARVILPQKNIKKYQVGPLIGQILLKNSAIDTETLNSALEFQNNTSKDIIYDSKSLIKTLDKHVSNSSPKTLLTIESEKQLEQALLTKKNQYKRFGEVIKSMGKVKDEDIYLALANKFDLPFVQLKKFDIDPECLDYLPQKIAEEIHAIPLILEQNRLIVAIDDPTNAEAINMLRFATGHNIELAIATQKDIEWAIQKYYGSFENDRELLKTMEFNTHDKDLSVSESERIGSDKPIVRLVHHIIVDAIHKKSSDIHIRPEKEYIELIYRIDGTLVKIREFSISILPALVSRIKIIGRMDISERRLPQDGRAQYATAGTAVDLRISIMPTVDGESVVIRILNVDVGLKTIRELGFTEKDQNNLLELLHKSYGLFLVTGPTGSGKSTTLYAALQEVQNQNVNIITIEDPVEYHMEHIQQIQINPVTGYTFARALRNILRHDPDVIMLGEIRDDETAKIAVESALTGHLVLSTLHTNDAPSTIARLLEMDIEPYLLNSCLLGVLAQRLMRKNCPLCTEEEVTENNIRAALNIKNDEIFYRGKGCDECNNTGYKGRMGVYELLMISDNVRKYIRKGVTAAEVRQIAIQEGMILLTENALMLARQRKTSLAEVYRVRLE